MFCATQLNRTKSSIQNYANKNNIKLNKKQLSDLFLNIYKKENKKFNVDANLFINPQLPEVIYSLGLLWADGHLNIQKNSLRSVCLKSTSPDGEEIYKIMSSYGKWNFYKYQSKNVRYKNLKPSITINTNNRPLVEFLEKMDYNSKHKSADKILDIIPESLQYYWYRGVFDGDGCLYINKSTIQVVFSGPYDQDWNYLKKLLNKLKVTFKETKIITKKGHKSSNIRLTGRNNCKLFLLYIYQNVEGSIYLTRKYNKYKLL
jgi:hypothetical protein